MDGSFPKQHLMQYSQPLGQNTSIAIRTHAGTIPSQPRLGEALSLITIELPTPHLHPPRNPDHDGDDDQDPNGPHFIDDATVSFAHPCYFHSIPPALTPFQTPSDAPPLLPYYPNTALPTPRPPPHYIPKRKRLPIQYFHPPWANTVPFPF